MKKLIITCLTTFVLSVTGCAQNKTPGDSPTNQESVEGSSIDRKQAREVSDTLAQAIIHDRTKDLYQLMEEAFRDVASEEDVEPMLAQLYSVYGKPLEVEYKSDEVGFKAYARRHEKTDAKILVCDSHIDSSQGDLLLLHRDCAGWRLATMLVIFNREFSAWDTGFS